MTQSEPEQYRVLLIDDDPGIRRDYTKMIRSFGYLTETAGDGQEAFDLLKGSHFDVILSDIGMPKVGGLAFLHMVRTYDLDVPVVLMTGLPDLQSAIDAVEEGAFSYLTKPVRLDKLERVLQQAVGMHQIGKLKRELLDFSGSLAKQLGDRVSLDVRFGNALKELWIAYQPIVRWPERTVFGYEALVRSNEPTLKNPVDLLDAAERLGRLHDLGRLIRDRVSRSAHSVERGILLFVNLHPLDLNDLKLFDPTAPLSSIASRVILEITERVSLHQVTGLVKKIEKLRELGFRIAIDDLGAGYAGLGALSQINPEFVKLDGSLVNGIDKSERMQSIVKAISTLCTKNLGMQIVGEGVETTVERDILARNGCNLHQGFLFAKPDHGFPLPHW
jgi:EAL domain-containing protein (putative c-di-GMP-specific phosphodiesterase class I)/CheY-like chemotaxis protein